MAAGIGEVRKHLAWSNTTVAIFSFSSAVIVLVGSYAAYGSGGLGSAIFSEAQTVVEILFFLMVFQGVYYLLITKDMFQLSAGVSVYSVIDSESTYFIAFSAAASSCVYIISVVGHFSNSVSALTAAAILGLLFTIQLAYVTLSGRHEGRK